MSTTMNTLARFAAGTAMLALLVGCGEDKEQAVKSYESVSACQTDIASDATSEERDRVSKDCQTGFDQSKIEQERTATHYTTLGQCVDMYGPDRCGIASNGNGYVPFMTGFMLGYVAGGPVYHPYYYDRWHVVYSGGTNLGYYRSGYVVAAPGAAWTRSYNVTPIAKGMAPPPIASTRGGFGGSASAAAGRPVIANVAASPSGKGTASVSSSAGNKGPTSVMAPASSSARGGFGGSAAAASAHGGGGSASSGG